MDPGPGLHDLVSAVPGRPRGSPGRDTRRDQHESPVPENPLGQEVLPDPPAHGGTLKGRVLAGPVRVTAFPGIRTGTVTGARTVAEQAVTFGRLSPFP